jgi:hypothetical protein
MSFLSNINKIGTRTSTIAFPLQVEGYSTKTEPHTVTGINLATGERVSVFLRPFEKKENGRDRPEIIHFATETITDPNDDNSLSKVYTQRDGVLLVDGAFFDKKAEMWSASWLRVLSHTANESIVEFNVYVCVNEPYTRNNGEKSTATVDVLYPERKVKAVDTADLCQFLEDMLTIVLPGKSICAVHFADADDSDDAAATLVVPRNVDNVIGYTQEDTKDTIKRFWDNLGDSEFVDNLQAKINEGKITVTVIPGARFYFVGKVLEALVAGTDKTPNKFKLPVGKVGEGERTHGFVKSTIALRQYTDSKDYFPIGVYPMQNFDAPVIPLQNLI